MKRKALFGLVHLEIIKKKSSCTRTFVSKKVSLRVLQEGLNCMWWWFIICFCFFLLNINIYLIFAVLAQLQLYLFNVIMISWHITHNSFFPTLFERYFSVEIVMMTNFRIFHFYVFVYNHCTKAIWGQLQFLSVSPSIEKLLFSTKLENFPEYIITQYIGNIWIRVAYSDPVGFACYGRIQI